MPGDTLCMKTRQELGNYVKLNDFVIVKIGASWCGPCKRVQPIVDNLFKQMPNNVHLVMVDADEGDIAAALRVKTLPTFLNYIRGELQDIYSSSDEVSVQQFFQSTLNRVKAKHP